MLYRKYMESTLSFRKVMYPCNLRNIRELPQVGFQKLSGSTYLVSRSITVIGGWLAMRVIIRVYVRRGKV
jgi:hypothetical protein